MRREREIELLERVVAAGPRLRGLHAPSSMINPASAYTNPDRFARESRILFREGPVFFAMSCELGRSGDYRSATSGGVPVLVIRQPDGSLRAMVNACRHRGAPLVPRHDAGEGLKAIVCPYHAWNYDLRGGLNARPVSEAAFEDVTMNCDLHPLWVEERYGMIFVRASGAEPFDADDFLAGLEDDFGSYGLGDYFHIESRTRKLPMNWKLVVDTFCESYHIRTLHRKSVGPYYSSDCVISEGFGPHVTSFGLRKSVFEQLDKAKQDWRLLPHATLNYVLFPNALFVHQMDHIEIWRIEPIDVHTTLVTTSIYAPSKPEGEKSHTYFVKNLDALLQVTDTEDFPLMSEIQKNLDSGALPEIIYGRLEPPLIHFHRAVNAALAPHED